MTFQEAVEHAKKRGHELVYDPPANTLSRAARYTCRKCGRAVLATGGPAYGSAIEEDCKAF